MNTLTEAIHEYVGMRQSLGFKLLQVEAYLKDFAAFMDTHGATWVTTELALQWAVQPVGGQPGTWAKRLTAVRGFARYQSATDARTEIPEPGLLANRQRRAKPYLYSENEISNLLAAASALKSNSGLRGQTYYCLFGLLALSLEMLCNKDRAGHERYYGDDDPEFHHGPLTPLLCASACSALK